MEKLAIDGGLPCCRLPRPVEEPLSPEAIAAGVACLQQGAADWACLSALSGSGPVAELEGRLADYLNLPHILALSSGTATLHAALLAAGVAAGDEVIVPAYTWGQSVAPVLHLGATPVFADIAPQGYTLNARTIAQRLTARTRAIIIVDLFGCPADVCAVADLAHARGIHVIEDCAQALGAQRDGRAAGGWADIACYSFGRGKLLTGGEGGALATRDRALYQRAVWLTQHPLRQRFELEQPPNDFAWNYRIHPIAAALTAVQIQSADDKIKRRQAFFRKLSDRLNGLSGLSLQPDEDDCVSAFYLYPLTYQSIGDITRSQYLRALQAEGVPAFADPISSPLYLRAGLRHLAERFGLPTGRRPYCPHTACRCRSGFALPAWVAETGDAGVAALASAFEKVAILL